MDRFFLSVIQEFEQKTDKLLIRVVKEQPNINSED